MRHECWLVSACILSHAVAVGASSSAHSHHVSDSRSHVELVSRHDKVHRQGEAERSPNVEYVHDDEMAAMVKISVFINVCLFLTLICSRVWGSQDLPEVQPGVNADAFARLTEEQQAEKLKSLKKERMTLMMRRGLATQKLRQTLSDLVEKESHMHENDLDKHAAESSALDALKAFNFMEEPSIDNAISAAAPVLANTCDTVSNSFNKRSQAFAARCSRLLQQETQAVKDDIDEVFDMKNFQGMMKSMSSTLQVPPVPILLAAITAKSKAEATHSINVSGVFQNAFYALLSWFAVLTNWRQPCHAGTTMGQRFQAFIAIDIMVNVISFVVAVWAASDSRTLVESLENPPEGAKDEDANMAIQRLVHYAMTSGADNLIRVQHMNQKFYHRLNEVTGVVQTVFYVYGVHLALNTTWYDCESEALAGLVMLRMRTILYLMLFLPRMISVLGTVLGVALWNTMRSVALGVAQSVDQNLRLGFPFVTVIMKTLLLDDRLGMIKLEISRFNTRKTTIQDKRFEAAKQLHECSEEHAEVLEKIASLQAARAGLEGKSASEYLSDAFSNSHSWMKDRNEELRKKAAEAGLSAQEFHEQQEKLVREYIECAKKLPNKVAGKVSDFAHVLEEDPRFAEFLEAAKAAEAAAEEYMANLKSQVQNDPRFKELMDSAGAYAAKASSLMDDPQVQAAIEAAQQMGQDVLDNPQVKEAMEKAATKMAQMEEQAIKAMEESTGMSREEAIAKLQELEEDAKEVAEDAVEVAEAATGHTRGEALAAAQSVAEQATT
eukprot:TRINITY_DN50732_c0_g1_i1.p1 TRINITY_DN50732_c0_g1~~TRINITY_DN50732_c0_g1_i1.p1  ORF type:complete len:779 (+),score=226.08 TRINITY_DN50732_c0_g1_i1:141-2477(+)